MTRNVDHQRRWAVILAGGDTVRLRSLTRLVSGDNRPRQFCPLLNGATLVARTRMRTEKLIRPDKTLYLLTRPHEPYYARDLADVPADQMIIQPSDRGTLPAILLSLMRVARLDPSAVVALFPPDHRFLDESNFIAAVDIAFAAAENGYPNVILLGAPAKGADGGAGWIQAEAAGSTAIFHSVLKVKRFWDKPGKRLAGCLLELGCVRNTFVMVGRAQVFLGTIARAMPDLYRAFSSAHRDPRLLYRGLPPGDFSTQVLSAGLLPLGVFCLGDVGWSDLGDPERYLELLGENGWFEKWRQKAPNQFLAMRAGA